MTSLMRSASSASHCLRAHSAAEVGAGAVEGLGNHPQTLLDMT